MSNLIYEFEKELDDALFRISIRKNSNGDYCYCKSVWRDYGRDYGSFHDESEYTFSSVSDNLSDLVVGIKAAREKREQLMNDKEMLLYL